MRVLRYSSGIELLRRFGWTRRRHTRAAQPMIPRERPPEQAPPARSGAHATALAKRACSFTQRSSEPGSISSNWPHGTTGAVKFVVALGRGKAARHAGVLGPVGKLEVDGQTGQRRCQTSVPDDNQKLRVMVIQDGVLGAGHRHCVPGRGLSFRPRRRLKQTGRRRLRARSTSIAARFSGTAIHQIFPASGRLIA